MLSAADFPDIFPWMTDPSPEPEQHDGRSPAPPSASRRRADGSAVEGAIGWLAPCVPLPAPPALVVAAMAMLRMSSTALPGQHVALASSIQPRTGAGRTDPAGPP